VVRVRVQTWTLRISNDNYISQASALCISRLLVFYTCSSSVISDFQWSQVDAGTRGRRLHNRRTELVGVPRPSESVIRNGRWGLREVCCGMCIDPLATGERKPANSGSVKRGLFQPTLRTNRKLQPILQFMMQIKSKFNLIFYGVCLPQLGSVPSSLAAVIGLSNNDVIALRSLRCVRCAGWKPRWSAGCEQVKSSFAIITVT